MAEAKGDGVAEHAKNAGGLMAEKDSRDKPELPTLDQLKRSSIVDYVVDRIEAEADSVEVMESGEVVITIGDTGMPRPPS